MSVAGRALQFTLMKGFSRRVEGLGHHLLAGAGLAGDEHRGGGGGHLPQLVEDAPHGGALGAEGLLQHVPALHLAEVAALLGQAALPLGQPDQMLRLLEAQGQQRGEDAHVVQHAVRVLAADHGVEGHEAEGLAPAAQRGHHAAVAVGHLQQAVEGVFAGVILLEGGGLGAGLEGVLQAQVAAHGDAGLRQLRRGEGADGVGHPEAVAVPQQDGGQVEGHQLAQALKGVGHHAVGLLAQG